MTIDRNQAPAEAPSIQDLAAGAHYPQVTNWTSPAPHAAPPLNPLPPITVQLGGQPKAAEAHGDERAAVLAAAKDVGLIDWVSADGAYFTFANSESMSDKLVTLWRRASKAQPKAAEGDDDLTAAMRYVMSQPYSEARVRTVEAIVTLASKPQPKAAEAHEDVLRQALERIADPRNTHFAGDAQVVAREALAADVQPKGTVNEEALIDLINSHLTGFYWCGRVWEAWNVGTMGEDDFTPAEETEFASGLAADVLKLLGATAQAPAPSEVTMADAVAAGDGTLHGAIDYWQKRALKAEAQCAALSEPKGAEPVAWQVWWGLGEMRPHWPPLKTRSDAEAHAGMIRSNTEVRPLYAGAQTAAPSAPAQGPVAQVVERCTDSGPGGAIKYYLDVEFIRGAAQPPKGTKLYAAAQAPAVAQQIPLTESHIARLSADAFLSDYFTLDFARAIERAHGIGVSHPPVQGSQS